MTRSLLSRLSPRCFYKWVIGAVWCNCVNSLRFYAGSGGEAGGTKNPVDREINGAGMKNLMQFGGLVAAAAKNGDVVQQLANGRNGRSHISQRGSIQNLVNPLHFIFK